MNEIDIDNKNEIDFKLSPNTDAEIETNSNGIPILKSHSTYAGLMVNLDNGKRGFSHIEMYTPPLCYVKKSTIHEHGVFAAKDFVAGDTIEESKIILLDSTTETSKDWVLNRYAMLWECDCDICKKNGKTLFIPTGNVLLYNHSNTPNAYIQIEKPFKRLKVIAIRNIKKDEEITWYYGKNIHDRFKNIPNVFPRFDIPEGFPAKMMQYSSSSSGGKCASCAAKANKKSQENNNTSDQVQFRSMIVPEEPVK